MDILQDWNDLEGVLVGVAERIGVIYCGSCGALNPRTNHYCSACGHQLVDAYHASEGLRVYATPDPGAPLIEIVDPGTDLTVVSTEEDLPADFAKVALADGRVGYVRLREVEAIAGEEAIATRREQLGCVSSTALLAIMALLVLAATLVLLTGIRSSASGMDPLLAVILCATIVPFFLLVVGLYFYVRKREEELLGERAERGDDGDREPAAQPLGDEPRRGDSVRGGARNDRGPAAVSDS